MTGLRPGLKAAPERLFERIARILGGWSLVSATLLGKLPILARPAEADFWVTALYLGASLLLVLLGIGIAHSTVFGLVTTSLGRLFTRSGDAIASARGMERRTEDHDVGHRRRSADEPSTMVQPRIEGPEG